MRRTIGGNRHRARLYKKLKQLLSKYNLTHRVESLSCAKTSEIKKIKLLTTFMESIKKRDVSAHALITGLFTEK